MTLFNRIGGTYNKTREADDRIVAELIRLIDLEKNRIIADIGAGTGNYSLELAKAGYKVKAVEPSVIMLSHSHQHPNIEWIIGCAEDIPLQTSSVNGIFSVLALSHFSDIKRSFEEMTRILKTGPMVIFTFDPKIGKTTWMYQYFPYFWDHFRDFPSVDEAANILRDCSNLSIKVIPFNLPPDLKDHFAAAAWKKPYLYLDEDYRMNISSFRMTDPSEVDDSVKRLATDLDKGRWQKFYGEVLHMDKIDAGYYFLCAT